MTIAQQQALFYDVEQQAITFQGRKLFQQQPNCPIAVLGQGQADVSMYRGNFDIQDHLLTKWPLMIQDHQASTNRLTLTLGTHQTAYLRLTFQIDAQAQLIVTPEVLTGSWNRLWLRIAAEPSDNVYGGGEQLSYFNLRGHHFPLWSSEPGIGRNKHTLTTFQADQDHAGGDYYTTNFPEATFISSQKYYCHATTYAYADFDFSQLGYYDLQFWAIPERLQFGTADNYPSLISKLTDQLGRTQGLPEWTNNGVIIGLQGGTERVEAIKQKLQQHHVQLAGLWCQDWEGTQTTSFGKRNYWEWRADSKLYPQLKAHIQDWQQEKLQFLAYINPYVVEDSDLFKEGAAHGYFAKTQTGDVYLVDFGEFLCGVVDFTNPAAYDWFKQVIQHNLIDIGIKGWMADFGEYLPTDVVLYDNSDPMVRHNQWPMLWAKCNYDAVQESTHPEELVYFMRAGATGSQKYGQLLWAGDQSVNWSKDDGIVSTIPAALSSGMVGISLSHSDIGGYTSMYGNIRSKELFMRWAEMAAFTPVMRTHEGNRPQQNFQVYDDDDAMAHLANCTQIFTKLTAYRQAVVNEAVTSGLPAQRPLMMYYDEPAADNCQTEYLFGRDLLVAPVVQPHQASWTVYLPDDQWINLWTGETYTGGTYDVPAPIGQTPVFYRQSSTFTQLFKEIGVLK